MSKKPKNNPKPRGTAKGVQLIVNGDAWQIVEGVEEAAAYGGDGKGLTDNDVVILDPDARRIVTGTGWDTLAYGAAISRAIEISEADAVKAGAK